MHLRSLSWSPTIALSWLWGLGFFYSIHVTFTYGLPGFLAFAIPNALGLALFGVAVDRYAPKGDLSGFFTKVSAGYGGVFLGYQALAVALTVFAFVTAMLTPFFAPYGPALAAAIVLLGMACGHMLGLTVLKLLHAVYLLVGAGAGILAVTLMKAGPGLPNIPYDDDRFFGLIVPTVIGFLLGPWLDIQHWQRAVEIRRRGGNVSLAYVAGGLIFLGLISINAVLAFGLPGSAADFRHFNFGGISDATGVLAGFLVRQGGVGVTPALLFALWGVTAMVSTVDSSYSATRWYLKAAVAEAKSPIMALLPQALFTTPIWMLLTATAVSAAAMALNLSLLDLIAPYATFFVGYSVCLGLQVIRGAKRPDTMACFLLGLLSAAVFGIGYYASLGWAMTGASLIPLIAAVPLLLRVSVKVADESVSVTVEAAPVGQVVQFTGAAAAAEGHGAASAARGEFDGVWFNYPLIATYDDTNAVGNVYFANYVRWVGKVREMLFAQCLPEFDLKTTPFLILTRDIFHQFVRETLAFEEVNVRLKIGKYNRKFATLEHEILNAEGLVVGKGNQQLMFVDSANYRLIDIPAAVIAGFMPYTPRAAAAA